MGESSRVKYDRLLIISLVVNMILLTSLAVGLAQQSALRTQISELTESYQFLVKEMNITRSQLTYYKTQAEYYSNLIRSGNATTSVTGRSAIHIVAVKTVQTGPPDDL